MAIDYEKRKINLPSWIIFERHKAQYKALAEREGTSQSKQIQDAMYGFITRRG